MESWSIQAARALKDAGNIGYAKFISKIADIDIAVLKSTRHNDIPPKENHVLIALAATQSSDLLQHLRNAVETRLNRTKSWMVTLKTLALIHRLLRDGHIPIFTHEDEQHKSSHKTLITSTTQQFEDCSTPLARQCSLWVRKYSSYLARRLHCTTILRFANKMINSEDIEVKKVLEDMKSLQLLVDCLLDCNLHDIPIANNSLIQFVLDLLMKECFSIYAALNVCICKILDEMPTEKAACLVEVYKRVLQQSEKKLSDFYRGSCILLVANGAHTDNPSPESFSTQLKDYITEYRHHLFEMDNYMGRSSIHIHSEAEEDVITKKETADEKNLEIQQTKERLITKKEAADENPEIQQDGAEETYQDNGADVSMSDSITRVHGILNLFEDYFKNTS